MKNIINKIVKELKYVFAVFKNVCKKIGSDLTWSHDWCITNLRFKPLGYYSPYRLYDTLEL